MRSLIAAIALVSLGLGQPSLAQDAAEPAIGEEEQTELGALMLRDFATTPDNAEQTIIDRRVAVDVEGQAGFWFYSQLNTGDELRLYRQRFHQLAVSEDGESLVQRSYEPVDGKRFADGWMRAGAFAALTRADMKPVLGEGCLQIWTKDAEGIWHGTVDPRTCEIFSERRQTTIRIGADSFYEGRVFGTSERGFDADMNPVWGSKPGEYITMVRCQSSRCEAESRALSKRTE